MSQGVTRLKEILFDSESQKLDELARRLQGATEVYTRRSQELEQRLQGLNERVGSDDRLRDSVAGVLDGALRQAEVKRHDAMNEALAPIVVGTMRHELKNSQKEMVDMLAPITGQLVKTYVANAFKDLMEQINRKLEVGMPGKGLSLRIKSLLTGQPVSELALAETQTLDVEELYLLKRGSGEVVEYWSASDVGGGAGSNRSQLTGGMLAALTSYAEEAFDAKTAGLKVVEFDEEADAQGKRLYVRGSPAHLLAVKLSGTGPTAIRQTIDDEFFATLDAHQRRAYAGVAGAAAVLPNVAASLGAKIAGQQAEARPSGGFGPLYALLALIAVPLLAWFGWSMWQSYETARTRVAAEQVLDATPNLGRDFVRLDVDRGGRALTVSGYIPTQTMRADVIERLRVSTRGLQVRDQLVVLPTVNSGNTAELEARVAGLQRDVGGIEGAQARIAILRSLERARARLATVKPVLGRIEAGASEAADKAQARRAADAIAEAEREWPQVPAQGAFGAAQMTALEPRLQSLRQKLAAAEKELVATLGITPVAAAPVQGGAPVGAEEAAIAAERLSVLALSYERVATVRPLERSLAVLKERVDRLSMIPPPPPPAATVVMPVVPQISEKLVQWLRAGNSVYFANGVDFRDDDAARKMLDELAALVKESPAGTVRVVGLTDDRGTSNLNNSLATRRAETVIAGLVERGIPRQRLSAVGRPGDPDARPSTGPQSPNRRVEFELMADADARRP